ncbi:MAG: NAD(P)/FAD-dependent oxidoreductase [Acidobacteria bacterium]|nr:NAD(P)/FAD-dependent oxidoreductase [Acidobacteriota bacterium]
MSGAGTVESADVIIVGGGAAGLATSIFCKRHADNRRVMCLDGARRVGAKILVSGGSRCNVTNRVVSERDFWGGSSRTIRSVLRAFPVERTIGFFREIGVDLHEEENGKLFPDSNSSRTVVEGLLREMARLGVDLRCGERVVAVRRDSDAFVVTTGSGGEFSARAVVLATGGRSLPKSGSDGGGYALAAALGHGYVPTTPALAPLLLDGERHSELSGVAMPARLTVRVEGESDVKLDGALLWTHFGASGPVVLDASRHWHRARLEKRAVDVLLNLCPGETFESIEASLIEEARARPRALPATVLAKRLPAAVAESCVRAAGLERVTMAHLTKDERRRLIQVLLTTPLSVVDSRGYAFAEATAGGVPLDEIDAASMASRRCPGLYLVGEILDVDGRLGGFNFQWAWSSAWVAGRAIASACQS